IGGGYYDPLLSAECQIKKKSALNLRATRVLGGRVFGEFSASFRRVFWRVFKKIRKNCIKCVVFSPFLGVNFERSEKEG
ncbi:hypothetical protein, partial [Streptococcus anginosus]|uniref:hypothetical protein n=1 Tax=Streptococcus anginosus TaxID=1328 RepID=UPI001CD488DE